MACSFPPSSATRLQAVDAAAVRSSRVPPRAATVSPVQRSLGAGCKAAAAARQEGATQDPAISGTPYTSSTSIVTSGFSYV